jgi:signal transduction histidine kinase
MNLLINGIDAMKNEIDPHELIIKSRPRESQQLMVVSITDTGVELPKQADHIFNWCFATTPHEIGMGLSINHSIIESRGGRLWATDNPPQCETFCFSLPTNVERSA